VAGCAGAASPGIRGPARAGRGIAAATGATLGTLAEGGNAAGAYLAGAVPHRDAAGLKPAVAGKSARDMLAAPQKAYLLFGGAEPWADGLAARDAVRTARGGLRRRGHAVCRRDAQVCGARVAADLHVRRDLGHLREPRGPVAKLAGAAKPLGEAAPGWKVLRVLGNLAACAVRLPVVRGSARGTARCVARDIAADSYQGSHRGTEWRRGRMRVVDVPMYAVDAVLRRAPSLQRTREGKLAALVYGGQALMWPLS
jgi:NADH-quinone oxidoreductase subunit G